MGLIHNLWGKFQFLARHPGFEERPVGALWRAFLWYFMVALGMTPMRSVPEWKARFELPRRWKTPAKVFYIFGRGYEEEVEFFEEFLQPGDRMLDIGANFGLYSLMAAARVGPSGRVDAFEPFPESFALLERNIAANRSGFVHAFPFALGERSSTAILSLHADPGRNSIANLGEASVGTLPVRVEPLDAVLPEPGRPVDAIKIDVEGWELAVFRGAARILSASRPVIVLEVYPARCTSAGSSYEALLSHLTDLGYKFFLYRGGRTLQRGMPRDFGNWVVIHPVQLERFAGWCFKD
jgi:FkbM family methyltransferase